MLSKTAERFLPVADGDVVDFFLKKSSYIPSKLTSSPSEKAVMDVWQKLSADDLISLVRSINDANILDKVLVKEKRKTILRAIAENENLSQISRFYLYQLSIKFKDNELKESSLRYMDSRFLVESAINDSEFYNNIRINIFIDKLAHLGDVEISKKYFSKYGTEYLWRVATLNMELGVKLATELNYQHSEDNYSRYSIRNINREEIISRDYLKEYLNYFPSDASRSIVIELLDEKSDEIAKVSKDLLKYHIKNARYLSLEDILVAEKFDLIEELYNNQRIPDSEEAIDKLISLIGVERSGYLIIQHPNQEKSLAYFTKNYDSVIKNYKGSTNTLFRYVEEHINEIGIANFWKIAELNFQGENLNGILTRLTKRGVNPQSLVEEIPTSLISKVRNLPSEINMELLYERAINSDDLNEVKSNLIIILDTIIPRYEDIDPNNVNVIKLIFSQLHKLGMQKELVEYFQREGLNSEVREFVSEIIRTNPDVLESLIKNGSRINYSSFINLIDIISPEHGWSSMLRHEEVVESIFTYLKKNLGRDLNKWETAFTLFDDWRGTLPQLVEMCNKL